MPKLIKNGAIVSDSWHLVEAIESTGELSGENIIIPAAFWLQHLGELSNRKDVGVWINGEDDVSELANHVNELPLIAIQFPVFMDGRGFSTARLLRDRYQYKGELRAIGSFIRDQLAYLHRCGFDAFSLSDDIDAEGAINSLNTFSEHYQAASDQSLPLFRRR